MPRIGTIQEKQAAQRLLIGMRLYGRPEKIKAWLRKNQTDPRHSDVTHAAMMHHPDDLVAIQKAAGTAN